jgi:hypothetical protein
VFGPWQGKLDNSGEAIELLRPDNPNTNLVPYILVEKVAYRDDDPWPAGADGLGSSLQRQPIAAFGNDPAHWFAAPPTPGAEQHAEPSADGGLQTRARVQCSNGRSTCRFRPRPLIPTARSRGSSSSITRTKLGEDVDRPLHLPGRTSPPARISSPRAPRTTAWEPPCPRRSRSRFVPNRPP